MICWALVALPWIYLLCLSLVRTTDPTPRQTGHKAGTFVLLAVQPFSPQHQVGPCLAGTGHRGVWHCAPAGLYQAPLLQFLPTDFLHVQTAFPLASSLFLMRARETSCHCHTHAGRMERRRASSPGPMGPSPPQLLRAPLVMASSCPSGRPSAERGQEPSALLTHPNHLSPTAHGAPWKRRDRSSACALFDAS